MEFLKKYVNTVIILTGILVSVRWMNGKFNDIDNRLSRLENRLTKIETTMILSGIPKEVFANEIGPFREYGEKVYEYKFNK